MMSSSGSARPGADAHKSPPVRGQREAIEAAARALGGEAEHMSYLACGDDHYQAACEDCEWWGPKRPPGQDGKLQAKRDLAEHDGSRPPERALKVARAVLGAAYPFIARAVRSRLAEALRDGHHVGTERVTYYSAARFIESLSDDDLVGRDERD